MAWGPSLKYYLMEQDIQNFWTLMALKPEDYLMVLLFLTVPFYMG